MTARRLKHVVFHDFHMLIKYMYCCADVHFIVFYLLALRDAFSKVHQILINSYNVSTTYITRIVVNLCCVVLLIEFRLSRDRLAHKLVNGNTDKLDITNGNNNID